jgi:cytochrome c553
MRTCVQSLSLFAAFVAVTPLHAQDDALFERKIRPILAGTCFRCHGGERTGGKLRVDSREALIKGGRSGPALVPGNADKSLLVQVLLPAKDKDALHMPPEKQLPADVAADFSLWVKQGAAWPASVPAKSFEVAKHWAFQPVRDVKLPDNANAHPIDRFVAAEWEHRALTPSGRADRRTLIRRATFDLLGLPPTPEEIAAFASDASPKAFAKLVDRLLASPHYGERWGRHWLDVVRYADTAGETADFPVPDAWRYRNWVIAAFNQDKPFDRFVREQLAGDLLAQQLPPDAPPAVRQDLLVATGYIAVARRFGYDIQADHHLTIEDTLDVLGKSVLGLTIGCARCHDHKYDPVSTQDYYALFGIFDSTRYPFSGCEKTRTPRDMVALPTSGQAYAVADAKPHNVAIHLRGDPKTPGEVVPRRFLELFGGQALAAPDKTSGRLQLADWLVGPGQPLTARVMVNRIWQHHFGVGLVKTPSDFGTRGEKPSHPDLLDYLARRFIDGGWSIKAMHRLIMSSDAYQRSSTHQPGASDLDPNNDGLWRFARRRLSAEEIRDAILAVSGELDRSPGGPHPFPEAKTWGFTQHNPFVAVYDHNRRSVYLMTQRIKRHPFLALFDGPDANASTGVRHSTTVPTQSLFFMNDPFIHAQANSLAMRLLQLQNDDARLERAYRLLFGRSPSASEREVNRRFLDETRRETKGGDTAGNAWTAWLRVMFASNEFVYVD